METLCPTQIARFLAEIAPNVRYLGDVMLQGNEYGCARTRAAAIKQGYLTVTDAGRFTFTAKGWAVVDG